jgi:hypothetical protein
VIHLKLAWLYVLWSIDRRLVSHSHCKLFRCLNWSIQNSLEINTAKLVISPFLVSQLNLRTTHIFVINILLLLFNIILPVSTVTAQFTLAQVLHTACLSASSLSLHWNVDSSHSIFVRLKIVSQSTQI